MLMKTLYKILIVDDESILRNGLKHMCNWEKEGFEIVGEASNGKEALRIIGKERPNIVITDVVMPEINGIELTKKIKENYPEIKVLILSSFSEFNYIRETFKHGVYDYLLKTNVTTETILPILKSMAREIGDIKTNNTIVLREDSINKDIRELIENQSISKEVVLELKNYFLEDYFHIVRSEIYNFDDDNINIEKFKKEMTFKIREYLEEYNISALFIKKYIVIIINFNKCKKHELIDNINTMVKDLREIYNISPFSLSNDTDDINKILDIYKDVIEISGKTFYFSKDLITRDDIRDYKEKKLEKFDYENFNSYLIGLNFNKCKEYIKEYFLNAKVNVLMDEYSFKRFCQNIIYNTLNSLDTLGYDMSQISTQKMRLFKGIDLANCYNDIVDLVMEILNDIERIVINELNVKQESIIVARVKEFVNQNYKKDISVWAISEALNINYNYLSHHFKNETNGNLSSYINKVRIEKAKIYLADVKIPISDISEMVGFSEHNYLCKTFKKITNYTPSEYRRIVVLK